MGTWLRVELGALAGVLELMDQQGHTDISVAKSLNVSSSLYLYWEGQMIVLASIPNKKKKVIIPSVKKV